MTVSGERKVAAAYEVLRRALDNGLSRGTCLARWSIFVRLRDGQRCVRCGAGGALAAHHIARKVLLPVAQFDTGNGITLCRVCHRVPHKGFNGKPDLGLPMDAQNGEKIEILWELYQRLLGDAVRRGTFVEEHYALNAQLIATFRRLQDLADDVAIPGGSLEQACRIWRQTPRGMMDAILNANGFNLPRDLLQTGPVTVLFDD